jgi:hypothetical protein
VFRIIISLNVVRHASRGLRRRRIIHRFVYGILGFSPRVLDFSFDLFRGALGLLLGVASPFSSLALDTSRYVLDFTFNTILIHVFSFEGGLTPRRSLAFDAIKVLK